MKVDVLLGLQWGDEGKGKIVDVFTPNYKVIARFQGGPNAGHTLEFNGIKHVLHTIPSGIFHENSINVIGNGVVIDATILKKEIDALKKMDVAIEKSLLVSKKAHLILPTHRLLDAANEKAKGKEKIGSTLKGIGPTYMDKTGRNGLRVGDLLSDRFQSKYDQLKKKHMGILERFEFNCDELPAMEEAFFQGIESLKELSIVESEHLINEYINTNQRVLAEGAQGSLLDIDFGSYPFVTSSNTVCAGACTGLGIAPNRIGEVFGIFKAYCTRVGSGPFPTELFDEDGKTLAQVGNEFGATTGRPRRCGWLDLVSLKYAIMLNGGTQLILTKADVLSGFETIQVCTEYQKNGETTDQFPYDILDDEWKPVYKELPGWKNDLTGIGSEDEFPEALSQFISYLEKELGIPIAVVSVGPDRTQTIVRTIN